MFVPFLRAQVKRKSNENDYFLLLLEEVFLLRAEPLVLTTARPVFETLEGPEDLDALAAPDDLLAPLALAVPRAVPLALLAVFLALAGFLPLPAPPPEDFPATASDAGKPLPLAVLMVSSMRFFIMLLALNTSTRRGVIGTSSPVLGLRPMRSRFSLMPKLPNDDSLTGSPRARAVESSCKTISTSSAASLRGRPAFLTTASTNPALVRVLLLNLFASQHIPA